ncbi:uncharacterized protein [Nicotiana sylvestris]|uniref:uncharacterized protein n=1 Tax=Nicotiana sylvestris TaxID=4096 RepID=UPI00388C44CC
MNQAKNFIIWNIRGGNNEDFRRNFHDIIGTHHPCMVTLLETRMTSHGNLMNDFGFTYMIEVPAEGQSGGMTVLWDMSKVNVNNFVRRNNEIHAVIEVPHIRHPWLFSSIYASTKIASRNQIWDNITNTFDNYKGAWLLGGDFNDWEANEKLGGNPVNRRRVAKLWSKINYYNIMDLGFKGCKYIWSNNRKYRSNLIMERLDNIFSNDSWINLFPKASVIHLPKIYSDHNPILLELIPKVNNLNPKPFRLESFLVWSPRV